MIAKWKIQIKPFPLKKHLHVEVLANKESLNRSLTVNGAFVELPEVGMCSLPVNPLQSLQLQPTKFLGFSQRISH